MWQPLAELVARILTISATLDRGQTISAAAERFLNGLDTQLLALSGKGDHPIAVDIHSHPAEGLVVEEAIGWARPVLAGPARGARFSVYEVKQPLGERLTDTAWRERLNDQEPHHDSHDSHDSHDP